MSKDIKKIIFMAMLLLFTCQSSSAMNYELDIVNDIIRLEGLELKPYKDIGDKTDRICAGNKVEHLNNKKIDVEQCHLLIKANINQIEQTSKDHLINKNEYQKKSIIMLIYNIGKARFESYELSNLLKKYSNSHAIRIKYKIVNKWMNINKITTNGVKIPKNGLTDRRHYEVKLFFNEDKDKEIIYAFADKEYNKIVKQINQTSVD